MEAVHTAEPPAAIKWYYRPFWVLVLCFVVLVPDLVHQPNGLDHEQPGVGDHAAAQEDLRSP